MKNLFQVRHNTNGFFVYPSTNPPANITPFGDEISLVKAARLCCSLNEAVDAHILNLAKSKPKRLIYSLARFWEWRAILGFIADLLWKECCLPQNNADDVPCQNSSRLDKLLRNWL